MRNKFRLARRSFQKQNPLGKMIKIDVPAVFT